MQDLIIIGAGPAGLTALLYAKMYGLDVTCVGDQIGGKLVLAPDIIDYPGITKISGKEFVENLVSQITQQETAEIPGIQRPKFRELMSVVTSDVMKVDKNNDGFSTFLKTWETLSSKILLFATGNGKKQKTNRGEGLAKTLGVTIQSGLFAIDVQGKTNIPTIFAAGDCVVYPESLEQLATAVSSAIYAVSGIYEILKGSHPPILWGEAKIRRM